MKFGNIFGVLVVSVVAGCAGNLEVRDGPQAMSPTGSQSRQVFPSSEGQRAIAARPSIGGNGAVAVPAAAGQVTTSPNQRKSRRRGAKRTTVKVGETTVTWNDFTSVYNRGSSTSKLSKGEGVYMFSRNIQSLYTLPNGTQVDSSQCYSKWLRTIDPVLQSAYLKCHNSSAAQDNSTRSALPFENFVALARQAVNADGSCEWLGYDRGFDLSVRATGQLASASDERLFFAKLRCGG
ncbi:MAG: hypothetical protein ABJN72_02455 [Sulfitobacter sp.]